MLHGKQTTDMGAKQQPTSFADLQSCLRSTSLSSKYNLLSPTSTLSSGYESGCSESEIDEMLYSTHHHTTTTSSSSSSSSMPTDECEYFELESDQYVCLDKQFSHSTEDDCSKLQRVRESMINIIADLESLGYETSLDELSNAVRSSVKLSNSCSKSTSSSYRRKQHTHKNDHLQTNNNNNIYTKSPVDHLFTEIGQYQDAGSKEKLYDSLITNLAIDCSNGSRPAQGYSEEPIYEEIFDDSDFDFVSHSDTYRKPNTPPALPPRSTRSLGPMSRRPKYTEPQRRTSSPCLTEVQKVTWRSGCNKSSSWHSISV